MDDRDMCRLHLLDEATTVRVNGFAPIHGRVVNRHVNDDGLLLNLGDVSDSPIGAASVSLLSKNVLPQLPTIRPTALRSCGNMPERSVAF